MKFCMVLKNSSLICLIVVITTNNKKEERLKTSRIFVNDE